MLTSTSSLPKVLIAWSIMFLAPSQLETSSPLATASPPRLLDQLHHFIGGAGVGARSVDLGAEVVDHDLRAVGGEHQRVLAADAAAGTSDDCNSSFA